MNDYQKFLKDKAQIKGGCGFDPLWMPDWLFDFQKHLVEWSLKLGRAAKFADCGLGKTPMQLVWAENVVRYTNKPVLILTPLAVSHQTLREAEKFGIECSRSVDGKITSKITVTNYEKLHYFDQRDFVGVVCDESSIIKNYNGKRKAEITEFMRKKTYRLLCTATAAPNDFHELGTSSEALGYLGYQDMLSQFFKQETKKDYLAWGRPKYRFRGHAMEPFWRWVCSWAMVCRKPSDLGYDDKGFELPPLIERECIVPYSRKPRPGKFFSMPAENLQEQRRERRETLEERCKMAAERTIKNEGATVLWCHLNDEGDVLEKMIPEALQVSGSMSDEVKEERLLAFQSGELKTLITKPKIGCFGLNWQHCHNVEMFPSHSWEQYYQAVRRCWRFGQTDPVVVTIITTEGELRVIKNLQRKAEQANQMFSSLLEHMDEAISIDRDVGHNTKGKIPKWI